MRFVISIACVLNVIAMLRSVDADLRHGQKHLSQALSGEKAKDFLSSRVTTRERVRRGLFNGKEMARRAREELEDDQEKARLLQELSCRRRCWQPWSAWSPCDGKCGSGRQTRIRSQKRPADCVSVACPGPVRETRTCRMDCGTGGKVRQGQCSCHPGYRGQCCRQRVTCPRPPRLEHGGFGGVLSWPAVYDAVLEHRCREGYVLVGPEQRRCQLDGRFSGAHSRCQRISCPVVAAPSNGAVLNQASQYFYGDSIGYSCKTGYALNGVASRKCTNKNNSTTGKWSAFAPKCSIIDCGNPGIFENGTISGNIFTYGSRLRFSCNHGYQLTGSDERTCLETSKWSGQQPTCKEIRCKTVDRPLHGTQSTRDNHVDVIMTFACDRGYDLIGQKKIVCTRNGTWDFTPPTCKAIKCEDPGKPDHGVRRDDGLFFGKSANFSCHAGYTLTGAASSTCRADRSWSHPLPTCTACPKDHYKDGNKCIRCPANAHTVTKATASKKQCVCDHGFRGPNGGPCTEIVCRELSAPRHGRVASCRRKLGDACVFDCGAGYTLSRGSNMRVCTDTGVWDGQQPICTACPRGTYKASIASCLPCPVHSHTARIASSKDDCVCDQGYSKDRDAVCHDVNECATNDGKGPCQQGCVNFVGHFNCICTVPGFKVHTDGRTCTPDKQCTNLTETDAPDHGGLVCHWYNDQNSQQCTIKCNPGYELPTRINAFETCGPATGYTWSFRLVNKTETINPCIEEFFPDFRFEADSAYFVRDCRQLNESDKEDIKREFANTLTKEGVCLKRNTKVCNMKDVGIICGESRRKRGAENSRADDVAELRFNIVAHKFEDKSRKCDKICPLLRIPPHLCNQYCLRVYKRFLRAAVIYARRKLVHLYSSTSQRGRFLFHAANRNFIPASALSNVTGVIVDCPSGMKHEDGMCVPCPAGTWYSVTGNECEKCPAGTYQSALGQSKCLPCPAGQTAVAGSTLCQVCAEGKHGVRCEKNCSCVHGKCDPVTGRCRCDSGWMGSKCDTDVPGCTESSCFPEVTCTDVAAPGTGFSCGPCPHSYTGNGIACIKTTRSDL